MSNFPHSNAKRMRMINNVWALIAEWTPLLRGAHSLIPSLDRRSTLSARIFANLIQSNLLINRIIDNRVIKTAKLYACKAPTTAETSWMAFSSPLELFSEFQSVTSTPLVLPQYFAGAPVIQRTGFLLPDEVRQSKTFLQVKFTVKNLYTLKVISKRISSVLLSALEMRIAISNQRKAYKPFKRLLTHSCAENVVN